MEKSKYESRFNLVQPVEDQSMNNDLSHVSKRKTITKKKRVIQMRKKMRRNQMTQMSPTQMMKRKKRKIVIACQTVMTRMTNLRKDYQI